MTRVTGVVLASPGHPGRARALAGGLLEVSAAAVPTAWSSIPDGSTHHFLLQDSMVLSSAFFSRVNAAAKTMPDAALLLTASATSRNGGAVRQGAIAGARWVPAAREHVPPTGIVLPVEVADEFARFAAAQAGNWPEPALMSRFLRQNGIPTFVSVPNLIDVPAAPSACFFTDDPEEGDEPGLPELSVIPFYRDELAQCAIRMDDGWRTIPSVEYLRRFDIRSGDLRIHSDFDTERHWNAWLTGFAMGVVNRFEGHGVHRSGLVLDRALATIGGPGMHAWVWDGLRSGMTTVSHTTDRSSPSVRVACGDSFLGDHLLFLLAGRGYHVTTAGPADIVVYLDGAPVSVDGARLAICLTSFAGPRSPLPSVRTCVLRLGVPYGPGMPADSPLARFVWAAMFGQVTDFGSAQQLVHVHDIVDAVEAVMLTGTPDDGYTIANLETTDTARLSRVLGLPPGQPEDIPAVPVDQTLGWGPYVGVERGIRDYAEWLAYER
ncbi:hypothetical protein [Actinocrispum sp. NPDC049592]|uniref:NAD-dependent epimerase/dehydratase family protein n=1 Tax=Actinocrispum sp. NPDC049592 TaxID=3154835 RepID=UPI00342DC08E